MNNHIPVMLDAVLAHCQHVSEQPGLWIDGTFGRGGHASRIRSLLHKNDFLLLLDKDEEAIQHAKLLFANDTKVLSEQSNFVLFENHIPKDYQQQVKFVLLDLGVSSPQLDQIERGFSFAADAPLDMRMDKKQKTTAALWLQKTPPSEISQALHLYGDVSQSLRLSKKIAEFRQKSFFTKAKDLRSLLPSQDPSYLAKVFMAIRIAVNDELNNVFLALPKFAEHLQEGGVLLVITFHSTEERVVKKVLLTLAKEQTRFSYLGKTLPEPSEIRKNPRSRSAVLHTFIAHKSNAQRGSALWPSLFVFILLSIIGMQILKFQVSELEIENTKISAQISTLEQNLIVKKTELDALTSKSELRKYIGEDIQVPLFEKQ